MNSFVLWIISLVDSILQVFLINFFHKKFFLKFQFSVIWLLGNMFISALTNTGAFEIYYKDQTLYSALEHGGNLPKLHNILDGGKRLGLKLNGYGDEYR